MSVNTTGDCISYHHLFATMEPGVVYQNEEGRIISANPAAEKILGVTFDQMTGRTSADPNWKAIHEDGSEFSGDTHPAMVALNSGKKVSGVIMGVFNPITDCHRWISIHAVPEFKLGQSKPFRVYTLFTDVTQRKKAEDDREQLIQELQDALLEIKTLRGILPLCSFCKKIRDDKGYWNQVDVYIREHTSADISHSICPECLRKYFPDIYDEMQE